MTVQKAAKVVPVPTLQFAAGALAGQTMRIEQDQVLIGRLDLRLEPGRCGRGPL